MNRAFIGLSYVYEIRVYFLYCEAVLWLESRRGHETSRNLPSRTIDQTTANQERELREIAGCSGLKILKVYKDHGISSAKGRNKRPGFDALCRDATKRRFDVVMAWSVDRLGRSLQ